MRWHVRPEAHSYLASNVKAGSRECYNSLIRLAVYNEVEFKNHAVENIRLVSFEWNLKGKDSNWWWRLQALPFLGWYVSSYELQSDDEKRRLMSFCIEAIDNWSAKEDKGAPLAWHDHASAFRLKNIAILYLNYINNHLVDEQVADSLMRLINRHVIWLSDPDNYSRNTNHGLDQSMILYMVCRMFDTEPCGANEKLAYSRLVHEVEQAFTDEGVHKENSPGYQKYMLHRIGSMSSLSILDDGRVERASEHLIDKIKNFLGIITMPNGLLPPIGDTDSDKQGSNIELSVGIELHDYSNSGYIVAKGKTDDNREIFMVVKNCYLSNYHRHDDDLSIFIYYNGDTILGDGGIYKYTERDEKRMFLRSPLAHSIPALGRKPIRGMKNVEVSPKMKVLDGSKIQASSHMFGVEVKRTIDLSEVGHGIVTITDECEQTDDSSIVNFYLTDAQSAMVSNHALMATFENSTVRIASDDGLEDCRVFHGWSDGHAEESAIVSKKYGTIQPCYRMAARLNMVTSYSIILSPK